MTVGADGFTLVEVLLVIVVLAVLIAIALPALSSARGSARLAKSSANARSLGLVIQTFVDSNGERYPRAEVGVLYPGESRDVLVSFPYWQVFSSWTGVVYDHLPYAENRSVFISPGSVRLLDPQRSWPTSYEYSTCFVGDPNIWTGTSAPTPEMERAVRLSEVTQPSRKALLWDAEASFAGSKVSRNGNGDLAVATPIAFGDLSVRALKPSDSPAPVANTLGGPRSTNRLHNTRDGVRGSDF